MGKVGLLLSIYFCTMLLTAILSNASSVAVMFPIAWRMTQLSWKSRVYILMFAASGILLPLFLTISATNYFFYLFIIADFSTPIGYQTNLMVYGPGGYKFLDYARIGLPLQLLLCAASVFLTLLIYE
jgi:di/tricarboxylate transporter